MERAAAKVRERLLRATSALGDAGIDYAVVGGNAVASWVATIDEGAVRNSLNVELLVHSTDLPAVTQVIERAGFVSVNDQSTSTFVDGPNGKVRDGVRLHFSDDRPPAGNHQSHQRLPTVTDPAGFRVLALGPLVEMLLSRDRNEDAMLSRDLVGVGLIDQNWVAKFPPVLAERLQHILDTSGG